MSFLRQSVLLNILFVLESAFGLLIDVGIALILGATASSDALYAAWIIPQTIGRGIFQSLSHSLLGLFGEMKAVDNAAKLDALLPNTTSALYRVYGQLILVMVIVGGVIGYLLPFFSSGWVQITIVGADFQTQSTAIEIASIVGWLPLPLALSETLRAIYYFEERVAWPSISRIIGLLVTLSIFGLAYSSGAVALIAWAILIGAIVESSLSTIGIRLLLVRWPPLTFPSWSTLSKIITTAGVPFIGVLALMLASTGERVVASFFGAGTITLVTYANRIITSIERFVFRGLLISATKAALFDGLSQLRNSMRVALLFAVVVGAGLLFLAPLVVSVLFAQGEFTTESAQQLALILQIYSIATLGLALSRVPFGYVFALNDTKHILGFYLLSGVTLFVTEMLLFGLGVGVVLFGIGYALAMWVGYFYLRYVTRDSLVFTWQSVLWGDS